MPVVLLLQGCVQPAPQPQPRYVLGGPYQAGGVWHYPADKYDLQETGLASVLPDSHPPLTTNGEVFDQSALIAAHPTLQLPAIARITNLDNGLSTVVRINDRGTGNPARLIEVSRRTAQLLRFPSGTPARVELTVLPTESHAAADPLPDAPKLSLTAAPVGSVEARDLPPPDGIRGVGVSAGAAQPIPAVAAPATSQAAPLLRLPETLTQESVRPGQLMVRLDTFREYQYALMQRARVSGFGPRIVPVFQGRTRQFRVEIGPFADVAGAEAVLAQALAAGIPDARIVVE